MAKQVINLGTMADNKSGDPLRTAFTKVNENFTELYNNQGNGNGAVPTILEYQSGSGEGLVTHDAGFQEENEFDYAIRLNTQNSEEDQTIWGFNSNGKMTLPHGGELWEDALIGAPNQDYFLGTQFNPEISAEAYIGSGSLFSAWTEFNDDIIAVQVGWTVNINGTVYTVTEVDNTVGFQYRITAAGATFVTGTEYTFVDPVTVYRGWHVRQGTGALVSNEGGAIITSESFDNGEGQTYRDYNIELPTPDGTNEHRWSFRNDGKLSLPVGGDIVDDNGDSVLGGGPVSALIRDGATTASLASLHESYTEAYVAFTDSFYNSQNEPGFPWGLTLPLREEIGFLYYDQLIYWNEGSVPDIVIQRSNYAKVAYLTWREAVVSATISSGEKQWSFDNEGNITLPAGGKILNSNGEEGVNRVRRWTNSNNNTWRIEEASGGVEFEFIGTDVYTQLNATATATLTEVNYIDIDDSQYPGFYGAQIQSFIIGGLTYIFNGNQWLGGTTYRYFIVNQDTTPASVSYNSGQEIIANIFAGQDPAEPFVWWDADDLPNEGANLRGAIIDYHAYSSDCGTVIGTIKIAIDSGDRTVTHSEVTSGSSDTAQLIFWGRDQSERQLTFKRNDNENDNVMIQWSAKLFFGQEIWD